MADESVGHYPSCAAASDDRCAVFFHIACPAALSLRCRGTAAQPYIALRQALSGLQEASDQPVSIPPFGGFGAHPFGLDRCVGPAHEHGLCRLESGSDLLAERSTGAQLGVEPDISLSSARELAMICTASRSSCL
jgi:hypothetical protein